MSAFGGFGSNNNNNNTSSGFGGGSGFGSTNSGFGANNANTTTSGSIFGGGTATSGGFGSGGGGFGSSTSGFGAKPSTGFGSTATTTSGGGVFGTNTSTSGGFGGGGGFGATNTTNTGFGGGSSGGGGLFGQNKLTGGFGSTNTGASMFGGGGNTTGGFGNNNNATSGFGSTGGNTGFGTSNTATNTGTGFGGGFGAANTAVTSNNGTASSPFQAFSEKDPTTNQMMYYQSISCQQPYANKSCEELRVEDYLQGRRFGNTNGQAGSFGTSTGFGGSAFGAAQSNTNTGSSLFGVQNQTNTTGGFGSGGGFGASNTNNTTGGFGSTGGGLFGSQNKPPATGLFGASQATSTNTGGFGGNTGTGSGLFGGSAGGFGSTQPQQQSGGLFGSNQNKPTLGGFGSTNTNTSGFGTNTNTGGGLFGSNTNTNTSGGLFGQNNQQQQQQQQSSGFGGSTNTGGLFGNNQNKPAGTGLFGSTTTNTNTGGGLFGSNQNQQQQSGGLFGSGNNNNQQQSSGLFGASQNKPATGLFGSTNANSNPGSSLFGNSNQNQPQQSGGSLFGASAGNSLFGGQQNKPAGNSLFGGNNSTGNSGGSLFGGLNNNNNQQNQQGNGGSLFGSTQNQAQNNNSLFGSSFNSNNQTPQQNQLHASLTVSPYGSAHLFDFLDHTPPIGPLATPLAGARPAPSKTPSLLATTRLNSPIYTPRASVLNPTGTYSFSSNYGTPNSAFSVSLTPQQSSLLKPTGSLGSALAGRLAKSMSMDRLRDGTSRDTENLRESLLRPTPGSASARYLQSGSMRKLTIDRSLRTDLFAAPEPKQIESTRVGTEVDARELRKRVSFDNSAERTTAEPSASNALVRTEESDEEPSPALLRAGPKVSGNQEMQHTNGASLSTVNESGNGPSSAIAEKRSAYDDEVGDYWTKPSLKDLKNMSRAQLSNVSGFTVGRQGAGKVEFSPCDLSKTNLDDICEKIVVFKHRSVTVYPLESEKPPMGQGLNVPATIHLERVWPKNNKKLKAIQPKSGRAWEKYLGDLQRTVDTTFKSYVLETGEWTFGVQHFTTYGLDEDDTMDETGDIFAQQESSALSEPPEDDTLQSLRGPSPIGEPEDDTFDFKKISRSRSSLPMPGGFEEPDVTYDYDDPSADEAMKEDYVMSGGLGDDDEAINDNHLMSGGLGNDDDVFVSSGGAVQAPSPGAVAQFHDSMVTDEEAGAVDFAEDEQIEPIDGPMPPGSFMDEQPKLLRSILKPTPAMSVFASPEKLAYESWEEKLQRTMSPRKRDRQALRERQQNAVVQEEPEDPFASPFKRSMLGQSMLDGSALDKSYLAQKSVKKVGFGASTMGLEKSTLGKSQAFRSSMDIMNSLWMQEKLTKKAPATTRGFEIPYPKKPRLSASADLDEQEVAFHDSMKPSFANNGILVYSVSGSHRQVEEPLMPALKPMVKEHRDVRFARWIRPEDINTPTLSAQKNATVIESSDGFPFAQTAADTLFVDLKNATLDPREKAIWQLTDILFDTITVAAQDLTQGMAPEQMVQYESRLRMDAFGAFCAQLVTGEVQEQLALAKTAEVKALLRLTMNDVQGACEILIATKDFKLATLVAQLPTSARSQESMQTQIQAWRDRNDWSEMSEPVRALYSIVAGEVCTVAGKTGPAENRATTFCISEHFGLNWMQSLALRVFFGGHTDFEQAVEAYYSDLQAGREKIPPTPWWSQETVEDGEDTLMGILRLAISRADLETLFDPKTVSGSAVNSRVAWQLATFLRAKGFANRIPEEKLDQLTLGFSAELEAANVFVTAAWVLLHLHDAASREKAVSELLSRNARHIGDPKHSEAEADGNWEFLANDLQLPKDILWRARAQHAGAELSSAYLQAKFFLNASAASDAHNVLCTTIGPQAVIEQVFDPLLDLLDQFHEQNLQADVDGWAFGGQVFADFVKLNTLSAGRKLGKEGREVMRRLEISLKGMEEVLGEGVELRQRVAIVEMGRVLREEVREAQMRAGGEHMETGTRMEGVEVGLELLERYRAAMGVVA